MKSSTDATDATARPSKAGEIARNRRVGNLSLRILSSVVLGPLVLMVVVHGGVVFQGLLVAVALVSLYEWTVLVEPGGRWPVKLAGFGGFVMALAGALIFGTGGALAGIALAAVTAGLGGRAVGAEHPLMLGFGPLYVGLAALALAWIRGSGGAALVLLVLLAVWATDIGAYACGRLIGGPRLAPRISPKKTWAGLVGGAFAAALVTLTFAWAYDARQPAWAFLLGVVLALVEQGGDLFESWVKRRYNVKDSGQLIPGHGGLLDRIDGLLAVAPVFALFHEAVGPWILWG
ncbi:MAG: phosphatidate cytidylyltransferase [Azospirillaceae bacterium]|nr:phosphatidate cytidylyltransferase [Azospirillaceae bacterium]